MKLSGHLPLRYILSGLLLTAFMPQVQAAPLNLIPNDPNINTNGTEISYVYAGVGNISTLTITGIGGGLPSSQFITIPGGNSNGGGPNSSISNTAAGVGVPVTASPYSLTANFNDLGVFLDGTVSVGGYVVNSTNFNQDTLAEAYFAGTTGTNSGTVVTMDLVTFGFQGTPTQPADSDSVILEWATAVTGGDLAILGFLGGGVIANGIVNWGAGTGSYGQAWDQTAFMSSFASNGNPLLLSTYVPVPAAVWLFGSGLLGLVGVGARRRRRVANTG